MKKRSILETVDEKTIRDSSIIDVSKKGDQFTIENNDLKTNIDIFNVL